MPSIILLIALQAATSAPLPAPAKAEPQRWSVLAPVKDEPCGAKVPDSDATVCGNPLPSQRLPYPDEIQPDGPIPSNPELSGSGALSAQATPCPISRKCVVGFGPPIVPMVKGAIDLAKKAFAKKPDKTGRVAIPLDDSDQPKGQLLP